MNTIRFYAIIMHPFYGTWIGLAHDENGEFSQTTGYGFDWVNRLAPVAVVCDPLDDATYGILCDTLSTAPAHREDLLAYTLRTIPGGIGGYCKRWQVIRSN